MRNKSFFENRGSTSEGFDHWRYGQPLGKKLDDLEVAKIREQVFDDTELLVDIGCGTGYHINELTKLNAVRKAIGIDFSNSYVEKAKKLCAANDRTSFHQASLIGLSDILCENSVDVFVLIGLLQYTSDEELASLAADIDRFSKKRSRIIIKHPIHYGEKKVVKNTQRDGLEYVSEYKTFNDIVLPFIKYFDFKSMERVFHKRLFTKEQFGGLESLENCQQMMLVLDRDYE